MSDHLEQVYEAVRQIPAGRVASYKQVGQMTHTYFTARQIGRIMFHAAGIDLPWWRVVGSDRSLPIGKRDARLYLEQRKLLEAEGVQFVGDKVDRAAFVD
ncbi:MAG: MGMT family protein [Armatimonadetes bacterium]|nr:MGMT family protein [Armatimonadota bacterium]